jgi:hypothetical protein
MNEMNETNEVTEMNDDTDDETNDEIDDETDEPISVLRKINTLEAKLLINMIENFCSNQFQITLDGEKVCITSEDIIITYNQGCPMYYCRSNVSSPKLEFTRFVRFDRLVLEERDTMNNEKTVLFDMSVNDIMIQETYERVEKIEKYITCINDKLLYIAEYIDDKKDS